MMRAIRQHRFGPPETLQLEEVPVPTPAAHQVRIRVGAAGVHLIDTTVRRGEAGGPLPLPELPAIPGREVAGVVDAVGHEVGEHWIGGRVVAHLGAASGGYAEAVVVDVDAVIAVPDGMSDEVAVTMVGTGRTAMGVLEAAAIGADDVVLVTAAAGGIGSLAVQYARHRDATVVAAAGGPRKVALARDLGAHVAIDYLASGWSDAVRTAVGERAVTVALDGVGGAVGRAALELLGPRGRMVLYGWSSGDPMPLSAADLFSSGISVGAAIGPALVDRPGGLRPLAEQALAAAADGVLEPVVERFALADAAAAHAALESRATTGKVVLVP